MHPTLERGDWVLVDPHAYRERRPEIGDVVVLRDPRTPERWLVKRVRSVTASGALEVVGDAPAASTDSRVFGAVPAAAVLGRAWARYWPPPRWGRIR